MATLNDGWINRNDWIADPFDKEYVNPASLDLRFSGRFRRPQKLSPDYVVETWDKKNLDMLFHAYDETDILWIYPGEFLLVDTIEKVQIPIDISGMVLLKSTIARFGLEHLHAGFFDPGFGYENPSTATLELLNVSPWILAIRKGQPIVQIAFTKMFEQPEKDYRFTGRYNGQTIPQGPK